MLAYRFPDIHESAGERQALFNDVCDKGILEGSDLRAFVAEIEKLIGSMPTTPMINSARREIERELGRFLDLLPGGTFDDIKLEEAYERLNDTINDEFNHLTKG